MWQFFQDLEMTNPITSLDAVFTSVQNVQSQPVQGVVFFGNPNVGTVIKDAVNPDVADISISALQNLSEPPRSSSINALEQYQVGLYIYKVIIKGTTSSSIPAYPTSIGSIIDDGEAQLQCIYKSHLPSEVRLSFTENGLDSAIDGAPLLIGTAINSGSAIPVYYRITNSNWNVFNTGVYPQLKLETSEYIESSID